MDPATLAIAHWLVSNVGLPVLNAGIDQLLVQMGIKDPPSSSKDPPSSSKEQILIKEYISQLEKEIRQVKATLDEDRLAKLRAALVQVSESQKTVARREYLTNALNNFHVVVNYPEHGLTGNYTNAQLRCIAFVGMAAAHTALHDSQPLVAEKVVEAVHADVNTAKEWLGEKLVNQILSLFPPSEITCPKCGFQNPAGSQYCNRDGYPLSSGKKAASQPSTLHLKRRFNSFTKMMPLQIFLDNKLIGSISDGEICKLDIQAGHHTLFVHYYDSVNPDQRFASSSPHLAFDVAQGEEAKFSCELKFGWRKSPILLEKL